MRKIIQITASESSSETWHYMHLYALCDDGTVWQMETGEISQRRKWEQLPEIPQPRV